LSDWELLVPGIGLTVLGLAAVGISLAGVAKTFMEGMHAVGALVMFIGLIFFAAGILKDGLPRSNQAKAAVLIIIGFMATFGAFAVGLAQMPALVTFAGTLLLILLPAVVIAWAAHKKSPHFKAIAILFSSASVVGIIAFSIFGFVAPQPLEAGVLEEGKGPEQPEITGPTLEVKILQGSSVQGAPSFDPPEFSVARGTTIVWINEDSVVHSVTSGTIEDPSYGQLFDSGTVNAKASWALNTSELEPAEYIYFCTFHPHMVARFAVTEGETGAVEGEKPELEERLSGAVEVNIVEVSIVPGSANAANEEFYVPAEVTVTVGTTVAWTNSDTAGHTVTSGVSDEPDSWGLAFDSGFPLMQFGEKFEHLFEDKGEYVYFCQVHPWMVGKVIVT
jgi:plastocyanin